MVEEWKLPVLVMEKVFSYLDWKSLRTAMLVCKRWHEVDGHFLFHFVISYSNGWEDNLHFGQYLILIIHVLLDYLLLVQKLDSL